MMLVEETTVPAAALPVAEFREHLRMGTGFSDDTLQDGLLERHLRAALAAIEARTGKILIARSFSWTVTGWRTPDRQVLPVAPVASVTTITLADRLGTQTVAAAQSWQLEADIGRPALVAVAGSLPAVPMHGRARVDLVAGFGPAWTDIPGDLAQAVMVLAAHFYEYRHSIEGQSADLPMAVATLIAPYRNLRVFLGGGRT